MATTDSTHEAVTAPWASDVLDFWFKDVGEEGWWSHAPEIDAACTARFSALWTEKRGAQADAFLGRADEALAAILLFDQFPRNMFRGTADAFATDGLARDVARGAVAQGFDVQIGGAGRAFFYMPFQHSEDRADQALSLELFAALGDARTMAFAQEHHDIVEKFGRFPHRNAALGRASRPEEAEAVKGRVGLVGRDRMIQAKTRF